MNNRDFRNWFVAYYGAVAFVLVLWSGCLGEPGAERWPFIGVDELPEGGLVWVLDGAVAWEMQAALEAVVPVYGEEVLERMQVVDGRVYADELALRVWMREREEGRGKKGEGRR